MSFPRYERYKDSGVEWLGEVPEHWDVKRLKFLCNVQTGDKDTVNAIEDGDYPFFVRSQTIEQIDSFSFDCEAVLTAGDGVGVGKVFHYVKGKFDFHQRVYMMNNFRFVTGKFFFRYLSAIFYKVALEGGAKSTVDSLRMPLFMNFVFSIPSKNEQEHIIAFLDRETAKIDALIAEQQRLIELLKEKRQAVISHAVTKGLNPDAPMKDSGIEWLGEVPEHWEVMAFRRVARIEEGQVSPTDNNFSDWILIAPNHIESGTGRILSLETAMDQAAISGKYRVRAGEVIYSKIRPALNKVCLAEVDCLCSADMYPICTKNGLSENYLVYLMLSQSFVDLMVVESMRVAMPKVNRDALYGCRVAVPPIEEQKSIVLYIQNQADKYDVLTTEAQIAITLLQERRTALISAAVTGKIDVRGLVETRPEREAAA